MRSRVMPGSLVTMERRVPVRRLNSVDLPTLGRPTMTSDGRFWVMGLVVTAALCVSGLSAQTTNVAYSGGERKSNSKFKVEKMLKDTLMDGVCLTEVCRGS